MNYIEERTEFYSLYGAVVRKIGSIEGITNTCFTDTHRELEDRIYEAIHNRELHKLSFFYNQLAKMTA